MNAKTAREIKKLDKAIELDRRNNIAWSKAVCHTEISVMIIEGSWYREYGWYRDEKEWSDGFWFRPRHSRDVTLERDKYMRKMHDIYLAWNKLD